MDRIKILEELKLRIVYDETVFKTNEIYVSILNRLIEDSINIGLSMKFPFSDYSILVLPSKYSNWVIRCSEELYNNIGIQNIISYSENGISWSKEIGISDKLLDEIQPTVGVINE